MRIAVIGEGLTEFYCVPTIAGRLSNVTIKQFQFGGSNAGLDWSQLFRRKIVKFVKIAALSAPDKILIVLDRENRDECAGVLASQGTRIILEECGYCIGSATISVIVSNREFESLLFADYQAVDSLKILDRPVSVAFPEHSDECDVVGWLRGAFKPGNNYDKVRDGKFLAQNMRLDSNVLIRSRSACKLVKELTDPIYCDVLP